MLDITKHALFYWYSWKMLMAFAVTPNLHGAIFRSGFYLHMQKLIEVAHVYKTRIEKMPSKLQNEAPGLQLVNEIIASRVPLERQYVLYKEEKITPLRDSNSAVSTIDLAEKPTKAKKLARKGRANTMIDVAVPQFDESGNIKIKDQKKEKPENSVQKKKSKKSKNKSSSSNLDSSRKKKESQPSPSTPKDNQKDNQEEINKDLAEKIKSEDKKKEIESKSPKKEQQQQQEPAKKKRRKKKTSKEPVDERDPYVKELDPFIFDSSNFPHHEMSKVSSNLTPTAINRTMLEVQSLADSLPSCLTPSSGIFIRTNDENIHLMKVLIVGPPGTPYSLGLFEFDILIPNNYPQQPPQVKIVTTGNGSFRFNPNLYANGKVCLSLIGTWSGAPEEQWDPKVSTLLQVFISIQSLILVENPYYNEPGYQFSPNDHANIEYNANVRRGTTRLAILGQLKDKKNVFKNVIRKHCLLKKDEILQQCTEWNISSDIVKELTEELEKLQ